MVLYFWSLTHPRRRRNRKPKRDEIWLQTTSGAESSVDLGKADRAMDLHNSEGRKLNKYFVRIPFRTAGLAESGC